MSTYTQPYDFCIPDDEPECPDEYIAKARKQLLADNDWLANVIAVNAAVESESGDLAEKMWMSDIEESHQAAAEYSRGDY